jgi:hypothetical protein
MDECTNRAKVVPEASTMRAKLQTTAAGVALPSMPRSVITAGGRWAAACRVQDRDGDGDEAAGEATSCGPCLLVKQLGCGELGAGTSAAGKLRPGMGWLQAASSKQLGCEAPAQGEATAGQL